MRINEFLEFLIGCRFCPMCKPFGETSILDDEVYSTRTRGLLLWQIASGKRNYTSKTAKYIFNTGLDTPSYQWCKNHFPVHEMILAARMDLVELGLAPESVKNYKFNSQNEVIKKINQGNLPSKGKILFLPGDSIFAEDYEFFRKSIQILEKIGVDFYVPKNCSYTGVEALILGKEQQAIEQFDKYLEYISPNTEIVCDGPYTEWGIRKLISLNPTYQSTKIEIKSIYQLITEANGYLTGIEENSQKKYFFIGNEISRLKEHPFQTEISIIKNIAKADLQDPKLDYPLSNGTGAVGLLHLIEPKISMKISQHCIEQASRYEISGIVCDAILDAKILKQQIPNNSLPILTVLDLLINS